MQDSFDKRNAVAAKGKIKGEKRTIGNRNVMKYLHKIERSSDRIVSQCRVIKFIHFEISICWKNRGGGEIGDKKEKKKKEREARHKTVQDQRRTRTSIKSNYKYFESKKICRVEYHDTILLYERQLIYFLCFHTYSSSYIQRRIFRGTLPPRPALALSKSRISTRSAFFLFFFYFKERVSMRLVTEVTSTPKR